MFPLTSIQQQPMNMYEPRIAFDAVESTSAYGQSSLKRYEIRIYDRKQLLRDLDAVDTVHRLIINTPVREKAF